MAAEGRYLDALKLIKTENPFPAVCGAICNRRCEDACTRATIDQAVAIDEIKRFIAEQELKENTRFVPLCENHEGKQFTQKIAVIGAGLPECPPPTICVQKDTRLRFLKKNPVQVVC